MTSWTAVPFSEADGGFDGGPIDTMLMMQLFGRGLVVEPYLANIILTGGVLRRAASEPQKGRWLQPIIAGELQAALAFAEPQSRYEIANVATSASQDGGEWVLNGSKAVVPNGGHAGLLVIPARTGGDVLETLFEDGLGEDRGRRRAVTGDLRCLACGFFDQLGAKILALTIPGLQTMNRKSCSQVMYPWPPAASLM